MKVLAHMKRIINKGKKYCYNRLESYAIEHNRGRMVTISVSDLFYNHIRNMELSRCDIVVRYLAIENYFGKNNRGFEMYTKMQRARKKWFAPSSNISEETDSCTAANQFKELIASYEKSGYDRESHIILDRSLSLIDGSHRMALALYYGIKNITALVIHFDHPVDYSIDWFLHVGFSQEEIDLITDTGVKLRDRCNQPFSCVIWSPAVKLSDAIVHDLGYYGKVESVKKYSYEREEYKNIVRAVYAIDDIENWKVEKKLEHMSGGELVVVGLKIEEPSFRVKTASDKPISQRVERIKRAIRGRYREDIEDYFFDTILHIADNHQQSHYMEHIFETGIDFREVLEILKGHKYALIKVDVPFMPEDFPKRIPVGKDVDILCAKQDLEAIKGKLICLVQKYTEYEVVKKESADRLLLRLNLSGKTVFLLDCCSSYEGMPDEFLEYALQSRLFCEKGYYVLDPAAEAMIRRAAFHANGQKIYHQEYYEENRTEEIEAMFEKSRGGGIGHLDL